VNFDSLIEIFESTDPFHARAQFEWRGFRNVAVLFGFFIPLVALLSLLSWALRVGPMGMLVFDAAAIGFVYHLYGVWQKRPIKLVCEQCKKIILSNTPWVCGFKQCKNTNPDKFPFIHKCEHCGAEPKAYHCHHSKCPEIIFLTEDKLDRNYAYCLNSPDEVPPPDPHDLKLETMAKRKRYKTAQAEIAKLDEDLKTIRARIRGPKVKTAHERKLELCKEDEMAIMGVRNYCRKRRKELKEELKDHPEDLRDALDAIDAIERKYAP
jgi:hypothetical protein